MDFLQKYYPGIKKRFAEDRIRNVEELLVRLKKEYKKDYDVKS